MGREEVVVSTAAALHFPARSFPDRVSALLEKVDYRLATTDQEREAVFRLRYEAYLREGAVAPSFARRLSDRYDDYDNAWIYGVFIDGKLASSFRLHVASASHPDMVALGVFGDILEPELAAGKTIVDPTRFVADYAAARRYPELPYVTTRIGWLAGEYFNADLILATVRTEHQAFYKRVFGHRVVCEPRPYPTLIKPLSLMLLDYHAQKDRVNRRFPFFRSTYFERRMLFELPGAAPRVWSSRPRHIMPVANDLAEAG
jgi:hypothetical protein